MTAGTSNDYGLINLKPKIQANVIFFQNIRHNIWFNMQLNLSFKKTQLLLVRYVYCNLCIDTECGQEIEKLPFLRITFHSNNCILDCTFSGYPTVTDSTRFSSIGWVMVRLHTRRQTITPRVSVTKHNELNDERKI